MDFFDEAAMKAKDVFEVACKKTEEVVTTEKQRFDMSVLRSKLQKDYAALGRLCYESLKDSELSEGKERVLVEAIKEKHRRIAELNAEIQNAKNRDVCHACGAGIARGSAYCSSCGAKTGDQDE